MNSVLTNKKCTICGNNEMSSEYFYKTEQLTECCDVCGYFRTIELKNKLEDGKYPEDWKPNYDINKGTTGFVLKAFPINEVGHYTAPINKSDVKQLVEQLKNDSNISKFAISFKDNKGNYQTQIYYNTVKKVEEKTKIDEKPKKRYYLRCKS